MCDFIAIVSFCKMGAIFLRCIKTLSQHHLFLFFLPSPFLTCKNIFMGVYDGIWNCNSLKYNPFNFFDNFCFIIFYRDQNIR